MAYKTKYISIPVELCRYALTNHKVNQLKLFIYLKSICSGHIKFCDALMDKTCTELGIKSQKTFKKYLKWLISKKWITVNSRTDNYRLVGFPQLSKKLNFHTGMGVIFEHPFSLFKPVIIAAVITFFMKYKSKVDLRSECNTWRSRKNRKPPAFYSLPHSYLAKILKISKTNAAHYRNLAIRAGLIEAKPNFKYIYFPASAIKKVKKYNEEIANCIKQRYGKLFKQENDKIISYVFLRRKKALQNKFIKNGKF